MFGLFKKKEQKKLILIANYLIHLQRNFNDRGRYFSWTAPKLNFALCMLDFQHRHDNGTFLFENELKELGTHGVYYFEISKTFGKSPNRLIQYDSPGSFHGLTIEEYMMLQEFLEKNYDRLSTCIYSGERLRDYVGQSITSIYLEQSWMEQYYLKMIESDS